MQFMIQTKDIKPIHYTIIQIRNETALKVHWRMSNPNYTLKMIQSHI